MRHTEPQRSTKQRTRYVAPLQRRSLSCVRQIARFTTEVAISFVHLFTPSLATSNQYYDAHHARALTFTNTNANCTGGAIHRRSSEQNTGPDCATGQATLPEHIRSNKYTVLHLQGTSIGVSLFWQLGSSLCKFPRAQKRLLPQTRPMFLLRFPFATTVNSRDRRR